MLFLTQNFLFNYWCTDVIKTIFLKMDTFTHLIFIIFYFHIMIDYMENVYNKSFCDVPQNYKHNIIYLIIK